MLHLSKIGLVLLTTLAALSSQLVWAANPRPNVILFMLDGVRWQEFFQGSDPSIDSKINEQNIFGDLIASPNPTTFISGNRPQGSENTVSNVSIMSLPGYQSIMVGQVTDCHSNRCGRVKTETLQERILRELNLKKTDVATIASWSKIPYAVEKEKGTTFVNAGIQAVLEGETNSLTITLNEKQKKDSPPWDARKDEYTFAHAMNYLKNNKPRFLFLSLNDSDEFAHEGNYSSYINTLKGYNEKIKELFETLQSLGEYGQSTSVIITTDHGRGDGKDWRNHGSDSPNSKYIWIYGRNPMVKGILKKPPTVAKGYTHLDIRPTIEKLIGLTPLSCEGCGKVIPELIPPEETLSPSKASVSKRT